MKLNYYTYSNKTNKVVHLIPIFNDNYVFVIVNDKNQGLIVDPGEGQAVQHFLSENMINPVAILITHSHPDHIGGLSFLQVLYPQIPIIRNVNFYECDVIESRLSKLANFGFNFEVIFTPGHIKDHILFYEKNEKWLFCGDVLFRYGCGRIFDGTFEEMFESLEKIKKLPPETKIFCTHEYTAKNLQFCIENNLIESSIVDKLVEEANILPTIPFSLTQEMLVNPFLKADNFVNFKKLRLLRNQF